MSSGHFIAVFADGCPPCAMFKANRWPDIKATLKNIAEVHDVNLPDKNARAHPMQFPCPGIDERVIVFPSFFYIRGTDWQKQGITPAMFGYKEGQNGIRYAGLNDPTFDNFKSFIEKENNRIEVISNLPEIIPSTTPTKYHADR